MRFENRVVPLAAIDLNDQTFLITTERGIDELTESIKTLGLIHAPLLIPQKQNFVIISGFRRIQAALALGWQTLAARIATPEVQKSLWARIAIADNAQQRQLNLIETSRALALLSQFFEKPEERIKVGTTLGLPPSVTATRKIQRLCRLPQFIQNEIIAGTLSLSIALELEKHSDSSQIVFVEIFSQLRLSLSKQRELLTWVTEIARREGKDPMIILTEDSLTGILSDENLDRSQKTVVLRQYLKQRRFPALTQAKNKFEDFKKNLHLGNNFKLFPPPDFEGDEHIICMHFKSIEELKVHQQTLTELIENEHFKAYWSHS